jgi:hypothetical protein
LFRLYKRDFLGATDDGNFSAPNIQKAYYTTPQRNQIAVIFQKGQLLKWPENVNGLKMVDFFISMGQTGISNHGLFTKMLSYLIYLTLTLLQQLIIYPLLSIKETLISVCWSVHHQSTRYASA